MRITFPILVVSDFYQLTRIGIARFFYEIISFDCVSSLLELENNVWHPSTSNQSFVCLSLKSVRNDITFVHNWLLLIICIQAAITVNANSILRAVHLTVNVLYYAMTASADAAR